MKELAKVKKLKIKNYLDKTQKRTEFLSNGANEIT